MRIDSLRNDNIYLQKMLDLSKLLHFKEDIEVLHLISVLNQLKKNIEINLEKEENFISIVDEISDW